MPVIGYITANRIKTLKRTRHVVAIHPRKKMVTVDGGKYYKIKQSELDKL